MKIEGLNSLRFFAFLSIYLFHTLPGFSFGYAGVDFFFVLSSFLLTYLALKEFENTSLFSRLNFFIRRALRIFPLYFLILFFSFVLLPFIGTYFNESISLPEKKWMYLLFLSNYDYQDCIFALKFLWSIAAEEQFYLLFLIFSPLILKRPWVIVSILLLIHILFILYSQQSNANVYTHTITHFPNFSAGIIAAHLYYKKQQNKNWIFALLPISILSLWLADTGLLFNSILSVLFGTIILLTVQYASFVTKNILYRFTEFWGNYTYGLYVYSGFVITFMSKFWDTGSFIINFLASTLILFLVSYLSYTFFENKFLRLKKYYKRSS